MSVAESTKADFRARIFYLRQSIDYTRGLISAPPWDSEFYQDGCQEHVKDAHACLDRALDNVSKILPLVEAGSTKKTARLIETVRKQIKEARGYWRYATMQEVRYRNRVASEIMNS